MGTSDLGYPCIFVFIFTDTQENKENNISQDNNDKEEKASEDTPAETPMEVDTECSSTENKSDNVATNNNVKSPPKPVSTYYTVAKIHHFSERELDKIHQ